MPIQDTATEAQTAEQQKWNRANSTAICESENWANLVPRPDVYFHDFEIVDKKLMIPGPTNMHPRVMKALSKPIIAHCEPQFYRLLGEVQQGIQYLFQTENKYTFALTGSATCSMEASICNLMAPGDKLLCMIHGYWGERVADMGERLGMDVNRIKVAQAGDVFELKQIEDALKTYRPNLLFVCHADSSITTLQPLAGIGELAHKYGSLLLVDSVVSLCGAQLAMDSNSIDVLYAGAQKALSGPPGIGMISLSSRAVDKFKSRLEKCPISSFYMDLRLIAKSWGIDNNNAYTYHYTPAINLLYGLREAIALVVEEGLQNVVARHQRCQIIMETELNNTGLNLKYLVKQRENRLAGIAAILIPDDIDGNAVLKYLYDKYDLLIGGSLLAVKYSEARFWRLGYLGVNAEAEKIRYLCQVLKEAINHQRKTNSDC